MANLMANYYLRWSVCRAGGVSNAGRQVVANTVIPRTCVLCTKLAISNRWAVGSKT